MTYKRLSLAALDPRLDGYVFVQRDTTDSPAPEIMDASPDSFKQRLQWVFIWLSRDTKSGSDKSLLIELVLDALPLNSETITALVEDIKNERNESHKLLFELLEHHQFNFVHRLLDPENGISERDSTYIQSRLSLKIPNKELTLLHYGIYSNNERLITFCYQLPKSYKFKVKNANACHISIILKQDRALQLVSRHCELSMAGNDSTDLKNLTQELEYAGHSITALVLFHSKPRSYLTTLQHLLLNDKSHNDELKTLLGWTRETFIADAIQKLRIEDLLDLINDMPISKEEKMGRYRNAGQLLSEQYDRDIDENIPSMLDDLLKPYDQNNNPLIVVFLPWETRPECSESEAQLRTALQLTRPDLISKSLEFKNYPLYLAYMDHIEHHINDPLFPISEQIDYARICLGYLDQNSKELEEENKSAKQVITDIRKKQKGKRKLTPGEASEVTINQDRIDRHSRAKHVITTIKRKVQALHNRLTDKQTQESREAYTPHVFTANTVPDQPVSVKTRLSTEQTRLDQWETLYHQIHQLNVNRAISRLKQQRAITHWESCYQSLRRQDVLINLQDTKDGQQGIWKTIGKPKGSNPEPWKKLVIACQRSHGRKQQQRVLASYKQTQQEQCRHWENIVSGLKKEQIKTRHLHNTARLLQARLRRRHAQSHYLQKYPSITFDELRTSFEQLQANHQRLLNDLREITTPPFILPPPFEVPPFMLPVGSPPDLPHPLSPFILLPVGSPTGLPHPFLSPIYNEPPIGSPPFLSTPPNNEYLTTDPDGRPHMRRVFDIIGPDGRPYMRRVFDTLYCENSLE